MEFLSSVEIQQIYSNSKDFDLCYYDLFGQEINNIDKSIYEDLKNTFNDAKAGVPKAYASFVSKVQATMSIIYDDINAIKPKGYSK